MTSASNPISYCSSRKERTEKQKKKEEMRVVSICTAPQLITQTPDSGNEIVS